MQLEHTFSIPVGLDAAWQLLLDIERVAGCIPGASIDAVQGDDITGALKVKLGPIGPTYRGTARITTKDADGHRAVVTAQADTRTNGSATAKLTATLSEFGGTTSVMLITDLELTGKPAQLEQTVIAEAGDRLARQFAQRLSDLIAAEAAALEPASAPATESAVSATETPPAQPEATHEAADATPRGPDVAVGPDVTSGTDVTPEPEGPPEPDGPPEPETPADLHGPGSAGAPDGTAKPERAVRAVASAPRHAESPSREDTPDRPSAPRAKKYAPLAVAALLLLIRRRRRRKRRRASA